MTLARGPLGGLCDSRAGRCNRLADAAGASRRSKPKHNVPWRGTGPWWDGPLSRGRSRRLSAVARVRPQSPARRSSEMADATHAANAAIHPVATQHLPPFITAPGETDVLMVVMAWVLVFSVIGFGVLFLRLHTLPERIAHKGHKIQFEIVAVLGLISLFTHMHIFWIIGLMLALIDIPDFGNALRRIAGSTEKMAGMKPGEGADLGDTSDIEQADEAAKATLGAHQGTR